MFTFLKFVCSFYFTVIQEWMFKILLQAGEMDLPLMLSSTNTGTQELLSVSTLTYFGLQEDGSLVGGS